MNYKKISELSKQIRGVTYSANQALKEPTEGYIPILRANNITETKLDLTDLTYVPKDLVKDEQILKKNDILIAASSGSKKVIGKAVRIENDGIGAFGAFCKVLRPNGEIDPLLFSFYFKRPEYRFHISNAVSGANINNIRNEHLDDLDFPIIDNPPHVADILDKADTLRQKRKESIKLLDEFLRSTFLEMFGDPVLNSKNIPIEKLDELTVKIGSGSTPRGGSKIYQKSGIMFIRSQNIHMNRMDLDNIAFITTRIHNNMKNTWVKNGDVLLNITGASIGRVAFFDGKSDSANVNQHVCIIRPIKEKLNPIYLSYMISQINYQNKILGENTGGTREAFNFKKIKSFDVMNPKIDLQNKFADIVQQVEKLKAEYKESEKELDNLFGSLMQRAFRGEL